MPKRVIYSLFLVALIHLAAVSATDLDQEIREKLERAESYIDNAQPGRAMPIFRDLIKNKQGLAPTYFLRGRFFNQTKQYKRALEDFNHAIKIDPEFALGYFGRAILAMDHDDLDATLKELNKALQYNPDLGIAYYERGRVYYFQEEFKKALADLDKAKELDVVIEEELYEAVYALSKPDAVLFELNEAIREDPTNSLYYHNRGVAYFYLGAYRESLADLKKARLLGYIVDPKTFETVQAMASGMS